jgi:uncharacterized protein YqeY
MTASSDESPLRAKLRRALTAAMKERDTTAVSVLRISLGAIDNAEAVAPPERSQSGEGPFAGAVSGHGAGDVARRSLSESEITAILVGELTERELVAADYQELGRHEEASRLRREGEILAAVLKGP